MNLRSITFLPSTAAACAVALTFSATAPQAQAIPPHRKGEGHAKSHAPAHHAPAHHAPSHHVSHPKHHAAPHGHVHHAPAVRHAPVHRVAHHGYHALPRGARPYTYRGVRYYRVGSRFVYPYFYGGRTVYIDVDSDSGVPGPPPVAGSIEINF